MRLFGKYSGRDFLAPVLPTGHVKAIDSNSNCSGLCQGQEAASKNSWLRVTFEQPETGIFRAAHTRGRTLGTVAPANIMALESLAFSAPISHSLPETLYGIHDSMLLANVLPARQVWHA